MKNYFVNWNYQSYFRNQLLRFEQGATVTLEDEVATWVNHDSEGCLTLVESEARAMTEPSQDRMVKQAKTRKDRGEGEVMTRKNFVAVVDKDN